MTPGIVGILIGLTVFILFYAIWAPSTYAKPRQASMKELYQGGIQEKSEELTSFDRYIRPTLMNFMPQSPWTHNMRKEAKDRIRILLLQSGNPFKLNPEEYVALQWLSALAGMVIGIVIGIFSPVDFLNFYFTVPFFAVVMFFLPHMIHTSRRDSKSHAVQKELPEALDLIVVTISAGKTFNAALSSVSERLPEGGVLKTELARVSNEIGSGISPSKSLQGLSYRIASDDVASFVGSVLQSEKTGADPTETLEAQAQFARQSYEAKLEQKTARLSTLMFVPLILTMLPAMMIIFLAPSLMQLGGIL